jgi:hypothetical protein
MAKRGIQVPIESLSDKLKLVERQKGEYKYEELKAPDFCENSCKKEKMKLSINVGSLKCK